MLTLGFGQTAALRSSSGTSQLSTRCTKLKLTHYLIITKLIRFFFRILFVQSPLSLCLFTSAFYTEPRLSVNVNCSSITLLYEAEGFPEAEVRWLGEQGEVLSDHTELSNDTGGAGGAVGLYRLKSSHVSSSSSPMVTFTLKNQLLHQDLRRPVSITYGN